MHISVQKSFKYTMDREEIDLSRRNSKLKKIDVSWAYKMTWRVGEDHYSMRHSCQEKEVDQRRWIRM
uniref:Uncharacterized protein n=1 Tax=Arion vulgaris TaxID=1028688 RepID=A0A0B7BLB0_9EUPU